MILGVSVLGVMLCITLLLALALALMTVFFIVSAAALLCSKRREAEFVRFDSDSSFEKAVYTADGEEFANLFPAEKINRSMIYRTGTRRIFLHKGKKKSFALDGHSVLIIALGLALSAASFFALTYAVIALEIL